MQKKTAGQVILLISVALMSLQGCDQVQSLYKTLSSSAPKKNASSSTKEDFPGAQPAGATGTVLARVNGSVISLESFNEKMNALKALELTPEQRDKIFSFEGKKEYLKNLIDQELIVQEAGARGIDKKKDVLDDLEEYKKGLVARELALDETRGVVVDRKEIEQFYEENKNQLAAPQEIRVRELAVPSEQQAKEISISLLQGADFASLAKEKSVAPSAANGGDLGPLKAGEGDKWGKGDFLRFYEVVATTDVGQVSQYFKGPDGNYYIVKVEEKKGGEVPVLSDVYEDLKKGLQDQKKVQRIQDLTDKLRQDAKIEKFEDLLR